MSESAMWQHLKEKFSVTNLGLSDQAPTDHVRINAERITERLNDGVPDVVYQFGSGEAGWVELKYLARASSANIVRIPWKSQAQPFWLQRWRRWGGRSGVLLRVDGVGWYYWRPDLDIEWVGAIQRPVSLESASWRCGPRLDLAGLLAALRTL